MGPTDRMFILMSRLATAALGLALACCHADPPPHPREIASVPPSVSAPPVASSPASPPPSATAVADEPPAALSAARRTARRLFARATVEPDRKKARVLFLDAAEALPPGGPALYQAGRLAARDGDAGIASQLFQRAFEALAQSTHGAPRLTVLRGLSNDRGPHGQAGALREDLDAQLDAQDKKGEGLVGLAVGADGRRLLVQARQGTGVYDTLGFRTRFEYHAPTSAAALSHDGALVVFATSKRLFSCSLVEATCARVEPPKQVVRLALSADGDTLATCTDGTVEVRDATTLAVRTTFRPPNGQASAVALSPAGDRVFVGTTEGAILRVRVATGEVEGERRGHAAAIVALAVDASGALLASADVHVVRVGAPDAAEGEEVITPHAAAVMEIVFSADGQALHVVREDDRWDREGGSQLDTWSAVSRTTQSRKIRHFRAGAVGDRVTRIALAPSRLYVAHGLHATFTDWTSLAAHEAPDPARLDFKQALPGSQIWQADQAPLMDVRAAGGTLGVVGNWCVTPLWDMTRGKFLRTVRVSGNCSSDSWRLSADGKTLFTNPWLPGEAPRVSTAVAVDVATGRTRVRPLVGDEREGAIVEPLPSDAPREAVHAVEAAGTLAWVDQDESVHVGPRAGPFRRLGKSPRAGGTPTVRVALSPKGARLGFRADGDRAEIWEVGGERPAHVIERKGISGITFGFDETAFVSALDGTLTMVREGAQRTLFAPDGATLFGLVPLRGGRLIAGAAAGNDDTTVHVFSAEDGALRATLTAYGKGAMATSPTGPGEVVGPIDVGCRFGPFVFELDLCRDRLVRPGLLARMLDGERIDP